MEQQELINKIKTLLPQAIKPNEVGFLNAGNLGQNKMLGKVHKALPDIINYIYEDLGGKIGEMLVPDEITAEKNPRWVYNKAKKDILSLLEIKDK